MIIDTTCSVMERKMRQVRMLKPYGSIKLGSHSYKTYRYTTKNEAIFSSYVTLSNNTFSNNTFTSGTSINNTQYIEWEIQKTPEQLKLQEQLAKCANDPNRRMSTGSTFQITSSPHWPSRLISQWCFSKS